jgi:hypothetical protein
MGKLTLATVLSGGDRRSIGRANEVVALVLHQPQLLAELVDCLWSSDVLVRMRAADAIEKISEQKAQRLELYKTRLLELMEDEEQQELRWHWAQVMPRLPLTKSEQKRAVACLRRYLKDRSSLVKTSALQGLTEFSRVLPAIRRSVKQLLEKSLRTGTPAMKARARILVARSRSAV